MHIHQLFRVAKYFQHYTYKHTHTHREYILSVKVKSPNLCFPIWFSKAKKLLMSVFTWGKVAISLHLQTQTNLSLVSKPLSRHLLPARFGTNLIFYFPKRPNSSLIHLHIPYDIYHSAWDQIQLYPEHVLSWIHVCNGKRMMFRVRNTESWSFPVIYALVLGKSSWPSWVFYLLLRQKYVTYSQSMK